ncbi:MAG: DUF4886 domain-containing protein [Pseudomonadota bacterium]
MSRHRSYTPRAITLVVALLGCISCDETESSSAAEAGNDILFVGNSFTYYNNSLHNHYRRLLRGLSEPVEPGTVRAKTISGGRLPEHGAGLLSMLDGESWDIVILQGHSRVPLEDDTEAGLRSAAETYAESIRDAGAEPVLFMTWAYTDRPEMTDRIDAIYSSLGEELGAKVAPVGLAFAAVTDARPEIALRTDDRRHPSLAGTYLAACVFVAVLRGESPEGNNYVADLDPDVAAFLQSAAWQTVQQYNAR